MSSQRNNEPTSLAMRTQYYSASSLDGFISKPDDSLDWLFPLGDVNKTSYPSFLDDVGAIAMGSSTYGWMLQHTIKHGTDQANPSAWPYEQPTWVFSSRTLPSVEGADIRFVSGHVRPVHEAMKAAAHGRNLWLAGGGGLVAQFYENLLDEIIVQIGSVTLCKGKPLLPRQIISPALKLVAVQQYGPGLVELRYEVPT